jgi:hypothetical protein
MLEDTMNPYSPPAPPGVPLPAAAYPMGPPAYGAPAAGAVSDLALDLMRQTRPWVIFLSVLCFLGSGVMLLLSLGAIALGAFASASGAKLQEGFSGALLAAIYLPLAAIYVYPGLKLWKYGSAIGRLLLSRSPTDLEQALAQQKSFWKYSGIAAIVMMVLYIVVIIGAVALGVAGALGKM